MFSSRRLHAITGLASNVGALALSGALTSCLVAPKGSRLSSESDYTYTGNIAVSLAHPYDSANDDYELLFAAPLSTAAMGVCVGSDTSSCKKDAAGFYKTKLIFGHDHRKFFRTETSALFADDLLLTIVALDDAGQAFDTRVIKLVKKDGSPTTQTTTPTSSTTATSSSTASPTSTPSNGPESDGAGSFDIASATKTYCGGGGCHPNYASNPESMKGSSAAEWLKSGRMPPSNRPIPSNIKEKMLEFIGN